MTQTVREVMTDTPVTMADTVSLVDAAREMRERNIGAVLVVEKNQNRPCGIVTDRDIVVRGVANGKNCADQKLADICSREIVAVSPSDSVDAVVSMMRDRAVRRVPVVENDSFVGIVSMGDVALARDEKSALAAVSAAPPNA